MFNVDLEYEQVDSIVLGYLKQTYNDALLSRYLWTYEDVQEHLKLIKGLKVVINWHSESHNQIDKKVHSKRLEEFKTFYKEKGLL